MTKTKAECEESRDTQRQLIEARLSQASLAALVGIIRLLVAGLALGGALFVIGLNSAFELSGVASNAAVWGGVAVAFVAVVGAILFYGRHNRNHRLLLYAEMLPVNAETEDCLETAKAAEEEARTERAAADLLARREAAFEKIAQPRIIWQLGKQRTGQLRSVGYEPSDLEYLFTANDGELLNIKVDEQRSGISTDGEARVFAEKIEGSPLISFEQESVERLAVRGGSWSVTFSDGRGGRQTAGPFDIPRSSQDTGVYVGFDEFELPEEA